MRRLALWLLGVAGLASLGVGLLYLLTDEFMPYHATVAGRDWAALDPRVRALVHGMLEVMGAGFAACGAALLWLLGPVGRGERWAGWAALTVAAAVWVPTLHVTLWLRTVEPAAATPAVPSALILALAALGAAVALAASSTAAAARAGV